MNVYDIIIIAAVVLIAVLAVRYVVVNKGAGCSGNCGQCSKDCAIPGKKKTGKD